MCKNRFLLQYISIKRFNDHETTVVPIVPFGSVEQFYMRNMSIEHTLESKKSLRRLAKKAFFRHAFLTQPC